MKKFWNFIRDEDGERVLRLEGPIDEDNFWGDAVTPKAFRDELEADDGNITVYINSPGGNVFSAAEIYTMLVEYKGKVTVKIDAIAASAASVIAMAGDTVLMSPVAMLLVHDPMTVAVGNTKDMEKAITTLNEVKESIINAYQFKSGLNRKKISQIMEEETWLNAKRAVELGFADGIITQKKQEHTEKANTEGDEADNEIEASWKPYSIKAMNQKVLNWLMPKSDIPTIADDAVAATDKVKEPDPEEKDDDDLDEKDDDDPNEKDDDPDEESDAQAKKKPSDNIEQPSEPEDKLIIGMDGKTKDGAMPYELLRKQLEYLR